MSVDPSGGPRYPGPPSSMPGVGSPPPVAPLPRLAPEAIPDQPLPQDPGFTAEPPRPGEEQAGPLQLSPEAEQWINRNVIDQGYAIDWGTREIFDPKTGEVKGVVPTTFDRMT